MKKITKILILLTFILSAGIASASVINRPRPDFINNGLVLLQTFNGKDIVNGKFMDSSTSGNNCTASGIASSTFYTMGKIGQAGNFDGSNDYLNCGVPASLTFTKDSSFTISSWVKTTFTSDTQGISGKYDSTVGKGYFSGLVTTNGSNYLQVQTSGSIYIYRIGSTKVADGKWHHIVGTYSGTSNASTGIKLYVDGVEETYSDTQTVGTLGAIDVTSNYTIGRRGDLGAQPLFVTGQIDEHRVYNRVLNILEIKELYNNGVKHQTGKDLTIKAQLPLDLVPGAYLAYGLRQLKSTYNGYLIQVRRSSDDATSDIGLGPNNPSGKGLDTTSLNTFCASTDCYITKWYNQNGDVHATASAPEEPQISISGATIMGSTTAVRPFMLFDGTDDRFTFCTLAGLCGFSARTQATVLGVMKQNSYAQSHRLISGDAFSFEWSIALTSGVNQLIRQTVNTAPSDSAIGNDFVIIGGVSSGSGGSQNFRKNGQNDGYDTLTQSYTGTTLYMCGQNANSFCQGYMSEMYLYPTALATSSVQLLETNMNNYYKIY